MVSASQDIDYFIERQRSKLNKTTGRPAANQNRRAPPPPPARQQISQPTNRLGYEVAHILDAPSPRSIADPNLFPSSPRSPFPTSDDNRSRRQSTSTAPDNRLAFFDSFGTYDEKRAKLREDRQREYNEFLRKKDDVAASKKKFSSKSTTSRANATRRVQFQEEPTVVAPWEKDGKRRVTNTQTIDDTSSTIGISTEEYIRGRSRPRPGPDPDEEYIRAREEYILELYAQIRELEERKRLLEIESNRLTNNTTNVMRAHYAEDLRALNNLLAERLNQRNAVDQELTRILHRPPISATPTHLGAIGLAGLSPVGDIPPGSLTQRDPGAETQRSTGRNPRNQRRDGAAGFQIGREVDKEAEQAAKKRYQQELLAQMREAEMRKIQAKHEKDEHEKKLDEDIKRYNYFGRSGGGAPMRDRDGNVVANLADLRGVPNGQGQNSGRPLGVNDEKTFSLGIGPSSITNAPYYNGQENQNPLNTARTGSPNHARGAAPNGIFGTVKTEEQIAREEKYKLDLKKQIDEKRQRNAEEIARRRAEEERELAKHIEWQQQMDKQMAEETMRKQERETQERQQQEEAERQRRYEESTTRGKPKRTDKPRTPPDNDRNDGDRQNTMDDPTNSGPAHRTSSPPVPAVQKRGKKKKTNDTRVKNTPPDDSSQLQPRSPVNFEISKNSRSRGNELEEIDENQNENQNENENENENEQPASPSGKVTQEKKKEPLPPKKKMPSSYRVIKNQRTASMTSLRSDGSDSETLKRLDDLKRQLNEKENHFYQQMRRQRAESALPDIDEHSTTGYIPPRKATTTRLDSPEYLLNTMHLPRRSSPTTTDRLLRVLQTDEDDEYRPSYFRDDSILMRGTGGYISPAKRVDLVDGIFVTNIEDTARRRRYDLDSLKYYDRDNPTSMASLQLDRIAEQNEMRLKKLRDLERDDVSMLDSNEVLERFQQKQRLHTRGSLTTLQDDAWLK